MLTIVQVALSSSISPSDQLRACLRRRDNVDPVYVVFPTVARVDRLTRLRLLLFFSFDLCTDFSSQHNTLVHIFLSEMYVE